MIASPGLGEAEGRWERRYLFPDIVGDGSSGKDLKAYRRLRASVGGGTPYLRWTAG